jgi:DNA repair exonuclease SbcCD ATPase subunit
LTSLTAIFGNNPDDSDESEKLRELYWNRAELKKEYASLREESFQLKQQIAAREGSSARLQQKLEHLESLLLDPDWVYNVVVYYQMRSFNERCKDKLSRFAEQLKQQREKRTYGKVIEEWNDERDERAQAVQAQIGEQRMQIQMLEDQLQSERQRFAMMSGFWRFLQKRSIARTVESLTQGIALARMNESELMAALKKIQSSSAPDTEGLDIASKRSINFMILSFAQQLYLHFSKDNLAGLAKETVEKAVGSINYGSKQDCDAILELLRTRSGSMDKATEFADILQQRAKLIAEKAQFDKDDDAVPVPGTVSTIFSIDETGAITEKDANLLGENYWDVVNVVSR